LEEASPELCSMKQSKVSLFGQYNPNSDPIYILSFKNQLSIIPSKQRPKKIVITGSNSKDYNYLLKGKEDLRLDERIMQLFSLINKMFYDPSER
jgi:FKBP12-rapamycin complex-associated protein